MVRRVLAAAAVAGLALGVAGSASAQSPGWPGTDQPFPQFVEPSASGPWKATYTYRVKGKTRTCTLTRGAKCVGAKLRGRVKHHGDLRNVNLRRADLRFADFRGANLAGADLRGANLKYADFRGANLKGAKLQHPPRTRPTRVTVGRASNPYWDPGPTPPCVTLPSKCRGANLQGADFSYSMLNGIDFTNANLSGAKLEGALVTEATLDDANLTNADLLNADLSFSSMVRTNLAGAEMAGAVFNSVNLTAANLTRADLAGVAFGGSNLTLANLTGARVTTIPSPGTTWPDVTWSGTVCPDGSVSSSICSGFQG
jgi:uncharacterized protein YjbI with pentapeptide repeats